VYNKDNIPVNTAKKEYSLAEKKIAQSYLDKALRVMTPQEIVDYVQYQEKNKSNISRSFEH
jgi:hypothetical protein